MARLIILHRKNPSTSSTTSAPMLFLLSMNAHHPTSRDIIRLKRWTERIAGRNVVSTITNQNRILTVKHFSELFRVAGKSHSEKKAQKLLERCARVVKVMMQQMVSTVLVSAVRLKKKI